MKKRYPKYEKYMKIQLKIEPKSMTNPSQNRGYLAIGSRPPENGDWDLEIGN